MTVTGSLGSFHIDSSGEFVTDFQLMDYEPQSKEFEAVISVDGGTGQASYTGVPIHWPYGVVLEPDACAFGLADCLSGIVLKLPFLLIFMRILVCLGLTSLFNVWGHIAMVIACSSGTLTNMLPHRNAMPQTQDMTPHPVSVYRHRTDLSLYMCYPLMWNVALEDTTIHFDGNKRHVASISSYTTTITNMNPGRTQEMMMSAHKNVVLVLVVVVVVKS